jgi:lysophospholipase L1-like esterase
MRVGKHRAFFVFRMLSIGGVLGVALAASASSFQAGFNQSLRLGIQSDQTVTFRLKVPIGRTGARLQFTFRTGDGPVVIERANVAFAGSGGALASQPATILFGGSESVSGGVRQRLMSDPVEFPVNLGDELYVSFEFHGALGASIMGALPDSYAAYGRYAYQSDPFGGNEHPRAVGLATIDVESDFSRAVLTIGDSITEGYVSGDVTVGTRVEDGFFSRTDDYRNAWSFVAQSNLGLPFANAGVSGQGVNDVLATFDAELGPLLGEVTDCIMLIGTNDLGSLESTTIVARIGQIGDALAPYCQVWFSTLVPKERTTGGDYETVRRRRHEVNDWLRQQTLLIDFEAVLAQPDDPDHFLPGLGEDGIHPSIAGQQVMGQEVARVFGG